VIFLRTLRSMASSEGQAYERWATLTCAARAEIATMMSKRHPLHGTFEPAQNGSTSASALSEHCCGMQRLPTTVSSSRSSTNS